MQTKAYVALGSNLGDRDANLRRAVHALRQIPATTLAAVSPFIRTSPQGGPPQPDFLNAAAEIQTALPPQQLLKELLRIEASLGRARTVRWGPRTIDVDLLLYGDRIIDEPELQVPHPRMHERLFVLEPLAAIAPGVVHPTTGKTVAQLLHDLASA